MLRAALRINHNKVEPLSGPFTNMYHYKLFCSLLLLEHHAVHVALVEKHISFGPYPIADIIMKDIASYIKV